MKHTIHKLNGYTLILIPNNNKTIHITACIKSGTMNETKENSGIHHLIEHILTEAWKPCGKQTCSSYWEKKGVNMNANTHVSYVNFYVNGLKEDIQIMLNYMFDIIISPFLKALVLELPIVLCEYQFSLKGNYLANTILKFNAVQIVITIIFYFINCL